MIITIGKLRKLIRRSLIERVENTIEEGDVIQFPVQGNVTVKTPDGSRSDPIPSDPMAKKLLKMAVDRGTLVQKKDGSYTLNPSIDWHESPYDALLGTIGDQGLIGDIEDFGPYEYEISLSKAIGPVDVSKLSGTFSTDADVEKVINMLIYSGGVLQDLRFKSKSDDDWITMREHLMFEDYPEEENEFYERYRK